MSEPRTPLGIIGRISRRTRGILVAAAIFWKVTRQGRPGLDVTTRSE